MGYYTFYQGSRDSSIILHVPYSAKALPFSAAALLEEESVEVQVHNWLSPGVDQVAKFVADKLASTPHRFINRLSPAVFNPVTFELAAEPVNEDAGDVVKAEYVTPYQAAFADAVRKAPEGVTVLTLMLADVPSVQVVVPGPVSLPEGFSDVFTVTEDASLPEGTVLVQFPKADFMADGAPIPGKVEEYGTLLAKSLKV